MARKLNHNSEGRVEDEPEPTEEDKGNDWHAWSKGTYAKSWYILLCLFIDLMITLQVAEAIHDAIGSLIIFFIIATLLFLEIKVFIYLWGRDGIWRLPSDDQD